MDKSCIRCNSRGVGNIGGYRWWREQVKCCAGWTGQCRDAPLAFTPDIRGSEGSGHGSLAHCQSPLCPLVPPLEQVPVPDQQPAVMQQAPVPVEQPMQQVPVPVEQPMQQIEEVEDEQAIRAKYRKVVEEDE